RRPRVRSRWRAGGPLLPVPRAPPLKWSAIFSEVHAGAASLLRYVPCSGPSLGGRATMAQETSSTGVKATLGLTGATMNAMALIAPGAFLWTTFQLQAAATAPDGSSVASDIWAGLAFALALCFLTAFSYSELARIYPEAGFGSAYYFAEKAFIDREDK